ncbi:hypothetical protein LL912_13930 [Niabella sp. CC-SYL272]|uniref:hypothetical protein n=1 Tax=Niabella agricola TaxID=2891571 RepID=UPI001F392B0D|nr:hypothetical protein [Niabella agricola]MCF3109875.1 hypothetical protein [Niabella agricola]
MILIFKTNIAGAAAANKILQLVKQQHQVTACTIDLEDCDKVLRVVGEVSKDTIVDCVAQMGFACEEL